MEVTLAKDGEQWKMNEVIEFIEFNQKSSSRSSKKASWKDSEIDRSFARCIIDAFEQGPQTEVEDLMFGESPEALEEVFEVWASRPSA